MSLHDPMDTETLANELARQGALLQEAQQAVLRFEQLTIQADQRSKIAEEKGHCCSHSDRYDQDSRAEEGQAQWP